MSATTQHEFHPDAESLNAFAEHALDERERGELLEHLAVCGRCREVVALAREAAEAEVEARPARQVVNQPNAWWMKWRLVWVPTAVAAAFAVTTISVLLRQVEQRAEVAKIEQQGAERSPAVVTAPAQPRFAANEPAPAALEKKKAGTTGGAMGERKNSPPEGEKAPLAIHNRLPHVPEPEQPAPVSAGQEQELDRLLEAPREAPAGAAPAIAAYQQEQRKRVEAEAAQEHMFAPRPQASGSAHGAMNGGQVNNEQVTVTAEARELETQSLPLTSFASVTRPSPAAVAARMAKSIHLPSGLPVVSAASAGHVMLAIDRAGAMFLSVDSGSTWEPVTKQWTGCAVAVRKRAPESGSAEAAPGSEAESSGRSGDMGAAPGPPVVFEILNDQSQVWWSTDGKIWTAK